MFKTTIGLEIHVELNTKSKMFCSCLNDPNERHPNVNICPVCMGHPGTLPVINKEAIRKVLKVGVALGCKTAETSSFDRKNYFYPDLPKGYQISQYYKPLCGQGYLDIPLKIKDDSGGGKSYKKIGIKEIHLEEDTGRLLHDLNNSSLVDFNRAGMPLMELVTKPDLNSGAEARMFGQGLQLILRYLNVSNADMEKGQMRVEANVSVSDKSDVLGIKAEIKNLNSFRAVEEAIEYEAVRQIAALERGEKLLQETRGWDAERKVTFSQRSKEMAFDYRYFPEPDLPPMQFGENFLDKIAAEVPELPRQKRDRLLKEYSLTEEDIEIFVRNKDLGEYFEKVVSEFAPNLDSKSLWEMVKLAANYLTGDFQAILKSAAIEGEDFLITPENFAEFTTMVQQKEISSKAAKDVLKDMFATGADPSNIVKQKGLSQTSNETEIRKVAERVISENQKAAEDFRQGKTNTLQFLIGKVMQETRGRANPEVTASILKLLILKEKEGNPD